MSSTTEQPKPAPIPTVIEFAKNELSGRLLQMCVSQLDRLKNPWSNMSEKNQEIALNAMREAVNKIVTDVVMIINAERKPRLDATVESVTFKDGIKATLTLSKSMGGRHELADAAGSTVCIIIASPEDFIGGNEKVKPQPDQKTLAGLEKEATTGYEIVEPKGAFKWRVIKDQMPIPNAPKGFDSHADAEKWLQEHLGLNKKKEGGKPDPAVGAPAADKTAGAPAPADVAPAAAPPKPATTPKGPSLTDTQGAFKQAGNDEAKKETPDWDAAWAAVAAKYPNEFVEEHYDELSKSFADGWEAGAGD